MEERDEHRVLAQARELVVGRLLHLHDELRRVGVADRRVGVRVEAIREARGLARAALDHDRVPGLREP